MFEQAGIEALVGAATALPSPTPAPPAATGSWFPQPHPLLIAGAAAAVGAVVVGLEAAAEEGDKRITSYRDHGHMLACGMDPGGVMAELTGREGGLSKGKGGSMHMFSDEKRFFGGHGIVAAQVPLGAGLAFAHKYNEDGGISVAYYGDGAANQGQVAETMNMAAL